MNLFEFFKNMKLSTKPVIVILGLCLLLIVVVNIVNSSVQSLILQIGRQQVEQETVVVQKQFAEAEQTILVKAKLLAYTPGLSEAAASKNAVKIRTALLGGGTWFNFDDIDIADTTGAHLLHVDKVMGIQEDTLLSSALQGIETTGVIFEEKDGQPAFRLAAVIPLRDQSGEVMGGVIFSQKIDEAFLEEISLSREGIELVFIHRDYIWSSVTEGGHRHSLPAIEAVLLDQNTINQTLNGQTVIAGDLVNMDGIPHMIAHMPLTVRDQPEAVVAILADQESLVTFQNQLTTNTTLIILLLGLTALVIVIFFARQTIIIPISKLQKVAQKMAAGDYSEQADITTKDEIGQLAAAFNKVGQTVQKRETELQTLAASLEERIEIRTNDLKRANEQLQQEIVEHEQASRALQQQHTYLRQVIDINPHFIFAKDLEGRFTLANQAFATAYRTTVEELMGKTDADFNPNKDMVEKYDRDDLTVIETGQELNVPEEQVVNVVGETHWRHTIKRPIVDEHGEPYQVLGIVTDITERKQAEKALEASMRQIERAKQEWEASVDSLPQLICLLDHQGRIIRTNRSVERWRLAMVTEVEGRKLPELLHSNADDPAHYLESLWSQAWEELVQGRSVEYEIEDKILGRHLHFQAQPISTKTAEMYNVEASSFAVVVIYDITERKRAEIALQKSEERLRHVFSSISDHIYVTEITKDGQHINRYLSPVEALTGYPLEKLLADWSFWPSKIIHPDDKAIAVSQSERFAKGQNSEVEYRLIRADGNVIWVRDSGRVEKDPATQSILVYGVVSDITARRQAEEALRESEATFRAVTTSAQDAIVMIDNDGNISLWNESAERTFGYTQAEALGQELHRLIVPSNYYNAFKQGFTPFKETGQGAIIGKTLEISAIRKNGTKFPVEIALSSVKIQGKWQAIGIIRDITERKKADEELRKLSRAVEQSGSAIVITNLGGSIEFVNPAFIRTTGYSFEETIGQNPRILKSGKQPPELYKELWDTISGGEVWQGELLNKKKNGELYWEYATISPVKDETGKNTHYLAIKEDITERKRAEEALAVARDQALEASRLKSQLLANVSHDLRTPLNAILGHTEMLQKGIYGPLLDKQYNVTERIIRSTTNLTSMVNKLMDQAQLEAGTLRLVISSFAPTDLLEHIESTMTVLAEAKGLQLTGNIAPDVPPILSGDLDRLHQILLNLVGNAIKFTEQGSVQVRIYRPNETHWAMQVSDTGHGIPAEAQSYIFDAFRQVDGTATRGHGGSGLGLSIVKQLTTMMGGQIKLESKVEQGSTFTVLLPLSQTQEIVL